MKVNELLRESYNFGEMQKIIYRYVIKVMRLEKTDAPILAKDTDYFWVSEFDDVDRAIENENYDDIIDRLAIAIEAVSEAIVEYYGNPMNLPDGVDIKYYKPLNADKISQDALIRIFGEIDEPLKNRLEAEEKAHATAAKKISDDIRRKAIRSVGDSSIEKVVEFMKKYDDVIWTTQYNYLKKYVIDVKDLSKAEREWAMICPKSITFEKIKHIKNKADLKKVYQETCSPVEYVTDLEYILDDSDSSMPDKADILKLLGVIKKSKTLSAKLFSSLS